MVPEMEASNVEQSVLEMEAYGSLHVKKKLCTYPCALATKSERLAFVPSFSGSPSIP